MGEVKRFRIEIFLADRVGKLPPYLFAALRKKIADKRAAGADRAGLGQPLQPSPGRWLRQAEAAAQLSRNNFV